MDDYIVIRVVGDKSIIFPEAKGYGDVEIRPAKNDFPKEKEYLLKSSINFKEEVNLELAQRIVAIVSADSPYEADEVAEAKFEQVLDYIDLNTFGLGQTPLLSTGMIKNLRTHWQSERLLVHSLGPCPSFARINEFIQPADRMQALLTLPETELKLAILRSIHWVRKAKMESATQLKCLFRWFSIETLTKAGKNEDICGKVMQALGFPLGRIGEFLSRDTILELQSHINYETGKRTINNALEQMRGFRNNTVHSGFRMWEIPKDTLNAFDEVTTLAAPRLQGYAFDAVFQGAETVEEFWEYFPLIFCHNTSIKNDLHGNILYFIGTMKNRHGVRQRVKFNI
ncbi:MAG: hypothetical protein WA125_14810 [Desulfosporosinus sp.]